MRINVYNVNEEQLEKIKSSYPDLDFFDRGENPFVTVSIQHPKDNPSEEIDDLIKTIEAVLITKKEES